jgi:hypothetical protein
MTAFRELVRDWRGLHAQDIPVNVLGDWLEEVERALNSDELLATTQERQMLERAVSLVGPTFLDQAAEAWSHEALGDLALRPTRRTGDR